MWKIVDLHDKSYEYGKRTTGNGEIWKTAIGTRIDRKSHHWLGPIENRNTSVLSRTTWQQSVRVFIYSASDAICEKKPRTKPIHLVDVHGCVYALKRIKSVRQSSVTYAREKHTEFGVYT